jgi:general secretion pathway protein K
MNRRGFALLAVLWVLAALAASLASVLRLARQEHMAVLNRMSLMRGRWAGEACEAILRARFAQDSRSTSTDTVDLGRGSWCIATLEDPQALINLNHADRETLRRALNSDSLAAAILDWRDADSLPSNLGAERPWYRRQVRPVPRDGELAAVRELRLVRGLEGEPDSQLNRLFTVLGSGQINLNTASASVLRALPLLDDQIVARIEKTRASGRRFQGFEGFLAALDPASRQRLALQGRDLAPFVTFTAIRLVVRVRGGVVGSPAVFRTIIEVVPSGIRLAVISRALE